MEWLPLSSGVVARYRYDARADSLRVEFGPGAQRAALEPLPDRPDVRVGRDAATGAVVVLEVVGVQRAILGQLIGDLLAAAGAPASPAPTPPPERILGGSPGDEQPAEESAGEPAEPRKRRRRRRNKRRDVEDVPADPSEAAAEGMGEATEVEEESVATESLSTAAEAAPAARAEPTGAAYRPSSASQGPRAAGEDLSAFPVGVRPEEAPPEAGDVAGATAAVPGPTPSGVPDDLATPPAFALAFPGLDERLGAAIAAMGLVTPTPIQRRAIPPALEGRDLKGLAQTGTGKTLAYLLPGMTRLLARPAGDTRPRMLVVTPTRELAAQVAAHATDLGRYTRLRVVAVYGGESMGAQIRALGTGADLVVATPGRLLDHVHRRTLHLDRVQLVVLDEADRMLDMGFMPDVRRIFELLPDSRQTLLFGATLPADIESLSARFQDRPELVEIARQLPPATLEQRLYPVGRHLKLRLLAHLLGSEPALTKVLVFTETKVEADVVTRKLAAACIVVDAMHGDRPQKDRDTALRRLREGELQVLVATNLAARGLDIEDLSHVVNYDMPQTVDDYVHRVGRTARGPVAEGTAYTFVAPGDEPMVTRIEAVLGRRLPRLTVEGFDYDVPTPSWARASAKDMARSLQRPGKARFSRSFVFKRKK